MTLIRTASGAKRTPSVAGHFFRGPGAMVARVLVLAMGFFNATTLAEEEDRAQLIEAIMKAPARRNVYPVLPTVPSEVHERALVETFQSAAALEALKGLDQEAPRLEWEAAIRALEKANAIGCLQVALCHPNESIQIEALRALARLKDARTVPFLLIYANYMAVGEAGSENATIHGILQEQIAQTLSSITGLEIKLKHGQDPQGLKQALLRWTLVHRPGEVMPQGAANSGRRNRKNF